MELKIWRELPPAGEEEYITMTEPPEQQKMVRPEPYDRLPVYIERSGIGKREIGRSPSRLTKKSVHTLPLVVLLCLFILWWCCFPVPLAIKQGRFLAKYRIEKLPLKCTNLEVAILAADSIGPVAAADTQNFGGMNASHQEKPQVEVTKNHHQYSSLR